MKKTAVPCANAALTVLLFVASACGSSDSRISDASADAAHDAETSADAIVPGHCDEPVSEASVCVGFASGHAGERVTIPVHITLPEGCPHTTQFSGVIVPSSPIGTFVVRPLAKPECATVGTTPDGGRFARVSQSATQGCPVSFAAGHVMDVQVDVSASTPPGDYTLTLTSASAGDNIATMTGGCKGDGAISGRLTVLP
jgi:hypothetical protein